MGLEVRGQIWTQYKRKCIASRTLKLRNQISEPVRWAQVRIRWLCGFNMLQRTKSIVSVSLTFLYVWPVCPVIPCCCIKSEYIIQTALFPSPSFPPSLCRLSLALVVTVFISSILEGLRRMKFTHSWVEFTKKGPHTVQHFIYAAASSLMKPEVVLTNCLISFWPTSVPRIRLVLISFINPSECTPPPHPFYCCDVRKKKSCMLF